MVASHLNLKMTDVKNAVTYGLLKTLLTIFYVVSHVYDYLLYPIYMIVYHPWRVGRYKRSNHASKEERDDGSVVFHSLQEPGDINKELSKANVDTLDKAFHQVCKKHGDRDCFGTRDILAEEDEPQPNGKIFKKYVMGQYKWISFNQFQEEAEQAGKGLRTLGLQAGDRVAVLAETRADWMVAAYACFQNSITIVTLYTNLGNDGVKHALNETEVYRVSINYVCRIMHT